MADFVEKGPTDPKAGSIRPVSESNEEWPCLRQYNRATSLLIFGRDERPSDFFNKIDQDRTFGTEEKSQECLFTSSSAMSPALGYPAPIHRGLCGSSVSHWLNRETKIAWGSRCRVGGSGFIRCGAWLEVGFHPDPLSTCDVVWLAFSSTISPIGRGLNSANLCIDRTRSSGFRGQVIACDLQCVSNEITAQLGRPIHLPGIKELQRAHADDLSSPWSPPPRAGVT
jgi:hypothetical protein